MFVVLSGIITSDEKYVQFLNISAAFNTLLPICIEELKFGEYVKKRFALDTFSPIETGALKFMQYMNISSISKQVLGISTDFEKLLHE